MTTEPADTATNRDAATAIKYCPACGSSHLSPPSGHRIYKCLTCHLAFDTPSLIPESWRFFDLGPDSRERYSIWEGEGYRAYSAFPSHPQGSGMFCTGSSPSLMSDDEIAESLGEEISFSELPEEVRRLINDDAACVTIEATE